MDGTIPIPSIPNGTGIDGIGIYPGTKKRSRKSRKMAGRIGFLTPKNFK